LLIGHALERQRNDPHLHSRLVEPGTNSWTGGSASAAGKLVEQLGGKLIGYLFILELNFLKGRDKLSAPVETLLRDDVMGT